MGTGWRNAFCTTIPRDKEFAMVMEESSESEEKAEVQLQSSRTNPSRSRFRLSSGNSNPSTPRLQSSSDNSPRLFCKTNPIHAQTSLNDDGVNGEKLHCKTTATIPKSCSRSPRTILNGSKSNPSSPRSPFSILKNSLCFSKNNSCGVCMQSVKAGKGKAIYTAECSHTFHFPCIVEFLGNQATLFCPICNSPWKDVPLFSPHKLQPHQKLQEKDFKTSRKSLDQNQIPFHRFKSKQENDDDPQQVKCYSPKINFHDDESLISPKFNPIPEEQDDDLDDEVGEFKGFFVNSTPDDFADSNKEFLNVEISLLPESVVIATGRTHETVAFIMKIKAPPPPPSGVARRAPIDLVSVLDVSGTMNGSKLQILKRAIRLVISSLGSADRLSIVAFAANPKRLMPLRRMNDQGQRLARLIIDRLECGSGTCANEALTIASKILEHRRERNPVASIILLSGGGKEEVQVKCDNQQQKSIQSSTTSFSQIEIPIHSFGLVKNPGYNHHHEEDAFSKCVGGLLSVVVQDLRVQLGSDSAEILAVYSCTRRSIFLGSDLIRVGDLYAEEEKEFLVEIRVPISNFSVRHVLSLRSSYKHVKTQDLVYSDKEHALLVPNPQTSQGNEHMRNLFISARAIAESRRMIKRNELNKAMQLLSSARTFVKQSKIESAKDHVNNIEVELGEVQRRMHIKQQMIDQLKIVRLTTNDHQGMGLFLDENGNSLTPTSAWKAADKLAKMAMMKKSFNKGGDLHGFENARF